MAINPIFEAEKREGKLYIASHVKARLQRWLATINEGTALEVIVRPYKQRVSDEQRAYYFGVVVPILASYFGYDTKEEVHEALKAHFNPVPSKIDPEVMVGGSTTSMSTDEFYGSENSFVKRIVRWAAIEYGINIPEPGEAVGL